ncbi:MAG: hypothetical protein ACD_51C00200G0002 [uncultured bacterium]|nr:MAG: hypothetical protein ACD_51C00200G0002 [uncultured bacterium]OGJ47429.1 MAG: hypothetical protein A2244_01705 [Candidatus Peregrinibacteria bacterium RIFOXYA2_FULL_41_18]OGJ49457.1 MAG: hypothetical protein A2344_00295 [Candidatus Peregrinibacteria bacterium RIFOXYB12_FULL_41_12]OGJ53358.1 MAG: hypothetical protein A2448_01310 [Candidatus Peregrinibacteria bacterium RIFOXYC2_FULL_41_22]OGJ54357.1 MAG: hypothetical protein A2336_00180 [Candidatus Peregrinibacteria bacterium RIFOXYB2_FULL
MRNDNLAKYIKILDKSSKEFRKRTNQIRKEAGIPENEKCDFTTGPSGKDIQKLLKDFFIPITRENISLVDLYFGPKDFYQNYEISYVCGDIPEYPPTPYANIKIRGPVSTKEWESIRQGVGGLIKLMAKNNVGLSKQPTHIKRKWDNIDLYLMIYRLYENGKTINEICNSLPSVKTFLGIKKRTTYTAEETRRMLKKIKDLIKSFHRQ